MAVCLGGLAHVRDMHKHDIDDLAAIHQQELAVIRGAEDILRTTHVQDTQAQRWQTVGVLVRQMVDGEAMQPDVSGRCMKACSFRLIEKRHEGITAITDDEGSTPPVPWACRVMSTRFGTQTICDMTCVFLHR